MIYFALYVVQCTELSFLYCLVKKRWLPAVLSEDHSDVMVNERSEL